MGIFDKIFGKTNKKVSSQVINPSENILFSESINSSEFKKIVSKEIAPYLRKNGWKGSGFRYTRKKYGVINEIIFQGSRAGRKFCINLNTEIELKQTFENKIINEENIWNFTNRLTPNKESDYWWDFPKRNKPYDKLIDEINILIEQKVDEFYEKWENWEVQITRIKSKELNGDFANKLFWGSTEISRQLLLSIHHLYNGNKEQSIEFANLAKAKIKGNSGSGRISLLNEIIKIASS